MWDWQARQPGLCMLQQDWDYRSRPQMSGKSSPTTCRDQYGIAPLVKLLEAVPASGVTLAAADAVRAVAMNNNENKTAVRENWGIPLLVKLLTEDVRAELPNTARVQGMPAVPALLSGDAHVRPCILAHISCKVAALGSQCMLAQQTLKLWQYRWCCSSATTPVSHTRR